MDQIGDGGRQKDERAARREIFRRVKEATVAVVAMNQVGPNDSFTILGSGFCIDPTGLIVTCRHVVEALMSKSAAEQIAGVTPEEKGKRIQRLPPVQAITPFAVFYLPAVGVKLIAYPCQVDNVVAKSDRDLAMLRVLPHRAFAGGYPYMEIEDYAALAEGDQIATYGFPLGNFLRDQIGTLTSSLTNGIISAISPAPGVPLDELRAFQLGLTATHGSSGGPVFSIQSGRVFGALRAGLVNRKSEVLPGLTIAEPVYPIVASEIISKLKKAPPGAPVAL